MKDQQWFNSKTRRSGSMKAKVTLFFASFVFLAVAIVPPALAAIATDSTSAAETKTYKAPALSVNIPTISLSDVVVDATGNLNVNFIGEYISGLYEYLLGFATLVAIVFVMIGGIRYVLAAGTGQVSEAKKQITNALSGLVLLLFVYLILFTVNPNLTMFKALDLESIARIDFSGDNGDYTGTFSADNLPKDVLCGTQYSLQEMVTSMKGKITYRFGGKGQNPPYFYDPAKGKARTNDEGVAYYTYCPVGTACYDCSGFAKLLEHCAQLAPLPLELGTTEFFKKDFAEVIDTNNYTDTSINGIPLVPGDVIGWSGDGHVWTYLGDGLLGDSHGGAGWKDGNSVGIYSVSSQIKSYSVKHTLSVVRRK